MYNFLYIYIQIHARHIVHILRSFCAPNLKFNLIGNVAQLLDVTYSIHYASSTLALCYTNIFLSFFYFFFFFSFPPHFWSILSRIYNARAPQRTTFHNSKMEFSPVFWQLPNPRNYGFSFVYLYDKQTFNVYTTLQRRTKLPQNSSNFNPNWSNMIEVTLVEDILVYQCTYACLINCILLTFHHRIVKKIIAII